MENIMKAIQSEEEFVTATIVDAQGSTPGRVGFRIIVHADRTEGTAGGGALEKTVIAEARNMLSLKKASRLVKIDLAELGMTCGGQVSVFFESFYGKPPLWIFGAGHIGKALAPLISSLRFHLTVVDNRNGFAVKENFPAGTTLMTGDYDAALKQVPADAFAVIVTHGHLHDEEILRALASREPQLPYIGMIGSRQKVAVAREMLLKDGIQADYVYAPIGLNIGGDTPEEIAVSIAAEILGVHHKKTNLPHCRLAP
ncbi:MAG: XdhC family protein [Candidatus Aminicenantales bacterium]